MNIIYKAICKIRQHYLTMRLGDYKGNGFIDLSVQFENPENITIGKSCVIRDRVWLASLEHGERCGRIFLGDKVIISRDTVIAAAYKVIIGNGVTLGPRVSIYDNNHRFTDIDVSVMDQGLEGSAVLIGDNAWVGINAIILPGVTVGKGAIVGAGSVVTKSVNDYKIVVGNPAKVIGDRRDKSNIQKKYLRQITCAEVSPRLST